MDEQSKLLIEQRLSVFSDEPDLNDWFEVMWGGNGRTWPLPSRYTW